MTEQRKKQVRPPENELLLDELSRLIEEISRGEVPRVALAAATIEILGAKEDLPESLRTLTSLAGDTVAGVHHDASSVRARVDEMLVSANASQTVQANLLVDVMEAVDEETPLPSLDRFFNLVDGVRRATARRITGNIIAAQKAKSPSDIRALFGYSQLADGGTETIGHTQEETSTGSPKKHLPNVAEYGQDRLVEPDTERGGDSKHRKRLHETVKTPDELISELRRANLPTETTRALRDWVVAEDIVERGDLQALDELHGRERYATMVRRVFGTDQPTVSLFKKYLHRLREAAATSLVEKQDVVRTVNFWKNELELQLVYEGQACNLSARAPNGYQLKATGADRTSLYGQVAFPKITCRKPR